SPAVPCGQLPSAGHAGAPPATAARAPASCVSASRRYCAADLTALARPSQTGVGWIKRLFLGGKVADGVEQVWPHLARRSRSEREERSMKQPASIDPAWGITIVRISTGLIFAVHGVEKFATGLAGVTAFFTKVGIPAPGLMAPLVAVLELVGG